MKPIDTYPRTQSFDIENIHSLSRGEEGTISDVPEMSLLASLGLRLGKRVKLLSKSFAGGPVVLSVDDRSIAVDRELAEKITIRK